MVLRQLLSDVDGNPSTKRAVTMWLVFITSVIALNNTFFGGSIEALATMAGLTTAGLTSITAERFGKFKDVNTPTP